MNIKLYNDNGCETLTDKGCEISSMVRNALEPIILRAVNEGLSLRDFTSIALEEIIIVSAEMRVRRGKSENLTKN